MKRVMIAAALAALLLVAAGTGGCRVPQVGRISGSGVPMTDERDVSGFERIDVEGFGSVVVYVGEGEYVSVEGDDNIVPDVQTIVRGGTLRVTFARGNYDPELPLEIAVGVRMLEGVSISGAVDFEAGTLRAQTFDLAISGAASAAIRSIDVAELEATVSGAGDCVIEDGRVDALTVSASGAGSFQAFGVECRTAEVTASGAGDVGITVGEELDATASGAGSVIYQGSPTIRKHTSGGGSVTEA
jgi:hypothetical protein